jgi:hypothetical protein
LLVVIAIIAILIGLLLPIREIATCSEELTLDLGNPTAD